MQKNIGILMYDMVQPMDFIGPWEIFSTWKNILNEPINLYLVSENGKKIICDNDISVDVHCSFETAPLFDYLIVPGGRGRNKESYNQNMLNFIKKQVENCQYILSVCTGMFLLYHAGLLKNKKVTTYWRAAPEIKNLKDVEFCGDRIVKSDKLWTAGGISSGIDLALELIAELKGKEEAGKVQLLFEYFPLDKCFCSDKTKNTLPDYNSETLTKETDLPEYIKQFIQAK